MTVWLIIAALFALAIALLADPRRGRHHIHARLLARPFERRRLTVAELEARLDAEPEDWCVGIAENSRTKGRRITRLHFARAKFIETDAPVKAGAR